VSLLIVLSSDVRLMWTN